MIEKKTTAEIVEACAWYPDDITFEKIPNIVWVSMESLKEIIRNNSNPCMKCGSVQCAICSLDLI